MLSGCLANNPWARQREYLESKKPKALEQSSASAQPDAPVRKLRVRVWVDSDYRAQQPRWDSHVRALLERASGFTRAPFGVELEPVAVASWERSGGSQLQPVLAELAKQDDGKDVDLVIGFVSALSVFTSTYHQLGWANVPGRHAVVRGIDNAEETDAIMKSLKLLGGDDKLKVLRERKEHKETAVLLHEWAHSLGVERDRDGLMAQAYSTSHSKFGPVSERAIIEELKRPRLDAVAAAAPFSETDQKLLELAVEKVNAGRAADGLATVRQMAERLPNEERVQSVLCWAARRAAAPDAMDRCRSACEETNATFACLELADGEVQSDAAAARARLRKIAPKDREQWVQLAATYRRAYCPTWAEEAAAHAEMSAQASDITEWAQRTRRWLCVEGMPPEDEAELLADFTHQHLSEKFPQAALTRAMQCEAALRAGKVSVARDACEKALATAPHCGLAHYLTGVVQGAQGRYAEAAKHLEEALEIEPANDDGWQRLVEAYQRSGSSAAAAAAAKRRSEHRKPE